MTKVTRYVTVNNKEFESQHEALLEELSVVEEVMDTVATMMGICADCPLKKVCNELKEDADRTLCSYFL